MAENEEREREDAPARRKAHQEKVVSGASRVELEGPEVPAVPPLEGRARVEEPRTIGVDARELELRAIEERLALDVGPEVPLEGTDGVDHVFRGAEATVEADRARLAADPGSVNFLGRKDPLDPGRKAVALARLRMEKADAVAQLRDANVSRFVEAEAVRRREAVAARERLEAGSPDHLVQFEGRLARQIAEGHEGVAAYTEDEWAAEVEARRARR
jgi:hypothetical protein